MVSICGVFCSGNLNPLSSGLANHRIAGHWYRWIGNSLIFLKTDGVKGGTQRIVMCNRADVARECYRAEKKQADTLLSSCLQNPTGLPLGCLSFPPGPSATSVESLFHLPGPPWSSHTFNLLVMAPAFSSACSDVASLSFKAGSLVLRIITCWAQFIPLDNPLLRDTDYHFIIFKLMVSHLCILYCFPSPVSWEKKKKKKETMYFAAPLAAH